MKNKEKETLDHSVASYNAQGSFSESILLKGGSCNIHLFDLVGKNLIPLPLVRCAATSRKEREIEKKKRIKAQRVKLPQPGKFMHS